MLTGICNQDGKYYESGVIKPFVHAMDGSDKYYFKEDASNFDDLFGKNTDYVIDPEECMADNFRFAVVYGKKGPEGKGYETPEIIDRIYEILAE